MLWMGLQSGNEALTVQCCALLREVTSLAEFPRTTNRDLGECRRATRSPMQCGPSPSPSLSPTAPYRTVISFLALLVPFRIPSPLHHSSIFVFLRSP